MKDDSEAVQSRFLISAEPRRCPIPRSAVLWVFCCIRYFVRSSGWSPPARHTQTHFVFWQMHTLDSPCIRNKRGVCFLAHTMRVPPLEAQPGARWVELMPFPCDSCSRVTQEQHLTAVQDTSGISAFSPCPRLPLLLMPLPCREYSAYASWEYEIGIMLVTQHPPSVFFFVYYWLTIGTFGCVNPMGHCVHKYTLEKMARTVCGPLVR